jgi:tetratricopeptide (TPR) repeat protein
MIETGLVYIYSVSPARNFVGCGALIEGGYIATCRHVWRDAIDPENEVTGEPPEVEIVFPFGAKEKASDGGKLTAPSRRARLADACGESEDSAPDLVLLQLIAPLSVPDGVLKLHPAVGLEVGPGRAHTYLISRNRYSAVDGTIDQVIDPEAGLRQFRGDQSRGYWFEKGSSGSPVFLDNGEQLAGLIALSELGANEGESHLHEAFVVPATTIHKYLAGRLAADQQAAKRGIDPDILKLILAKLGEQNVPDAEIAGRLDASIEAILAQAEKPVPVSNDGADIEATLVASREKLGALDTAGALNVLRAKIAEEEQERARRLVPLLKEQATIEKLAFDYDAAKRSLAEVTRLAPDDVWAFIDLGDLFVTTGQLEEAAKAFRNAEAAARRQGDERDVSVSYDRIGDVQVAQGDLTAALKSYQDSLGIAERLAASDPGNAGWQRSLGTAERLAASDPGNAGWQRDVSVSYNKIGDVQVAQGDLTAALMASDPGNAGWQRDLSVNFAKLALAHKQSGDKAKARGLFRQGQAIMARLTKLSPDNAVWKNHLGWFDEQLKELGP